MEPVRRSLELATKPAVAVTGARINYEGVEHVPVTVRIGAQTLEEAHVLDKAELVRKTTWRR